MYSYYFQKYSHELEVRSCDPVGIRSNVVKYMYMPLICYQCYYVVSKHLILFSGTIIDWVVSGRRQPLDSIPRDVPKEIHSQIEACWDQECNIRPSFSGNKIMLLILF